MKQTRKLPQITLLFRAIAGGYMLYLAWGLRENIFSGDEPLYALVAVLFFSAGVVLLVTSAIPLARGEFLRPGEEEEEGADEPADEEEETEPQRQDETE